MNIYCRVSHSNPHALSLSLSALIYTDIHIPIDHGYMCTAIVYKKTHDSTFLTVSNECKNVSFEKKKII